MSLNFVKIPSHILELAPLEHLKKLMNSVVTTLAHSFLIGSTSFLQATSKPIISRMGLNIAGFDQGLMSYLPLSVWKNPYRLIMGEILQPL